MIFAAVCLMLVIMCNAYWIVAPYYDLTPIEEMLTRGINVVLTIGLSYALYRLWLAA